MARIATGGGGRRGAAVICAMFIGFIVLLLGLALGSLASFQYHNATMELARRQAYEAAQAGLAHLMDNLARNPRYGLANESLKESVGPAGAYYVATFNHSSGVPWSTNNFQGSTGVPGYLSYVAPPSSALLFVTGYAPSGATSLQVAVAQLQAFNYAVAATGSVSVSGTLSVSGASLLSLVQLGQSDLTGDVYGGSSGISVSTGEPASINGAVRAVGTVDLAPGSSISQGTQIGVTPAALPDIPISAFNTSSMAGVVTMSPGSYLLPATIIGPVYVPGNLTLDLGAVMLNGELYVAGNLTVKAGEITGTGSIFVQGTATVANSLTLSDNTTIALFSQDELTMTGSGYFQGLLYSHTGIQADAALSVVGGVFVNATGGGDIVADQSLTVTYNPQYLNYAASWVPSGGRANVQRVHWEELQ